MVKSHRKKLPLDTFDELLENDQLKVIRMIALLRLSVLLHRSRKKLDLTPQIDAQENQLHLSFNSDMSEHALLEANLKQEQEWLSKVNISLTFT